MAQGRPPRYPRKIVKSRNAETVLGHNLSIEQSLLRENQIAYKVLSGFMAFLSIGFTCVYLLRLKFASFVVPENLGVIPFGLGISSAFIFLGFTISFILLCIQSMLTLADRRILPTKKRKGEQQIGLIRYAKHLMCQDFGVVLGFVMSFVLYFIVAVIVYMYWH